MSQLSLLRKALLEPNLLIPGKQPIGPVEVDWSNPLTKGLVGCWIIQNKGAASHNLATDELGYWVGSDNEVKPSLGGMSARITADNSQGRIHLKSVTSTDRLSGVPTGIISVYVYANTGNATLSGNDFPRFLDKDYNDGWAFYPNFSNAPHKMSFSIKGYSARGDSIVALEDLDAGYGATVRDNTTGDSIRFFFNGKLSGVSTAGAQAFGTLTKDISLLNRSGVIDRQNLAPLYCAFVWDRALSDDEHARIDADRYQFLKPAGSIPDIFLMGSSAGAPPPPTGNANWMSWV